MGSATVQGQLWGALATDWAAYGEQFACRSREPRSTRRTVAPLMPPPPPGSAPAHPGALSQPGELAAVLERAGLRVEDEGAVACPIVFPSAEISWRAHRTAGPNQLAISHSGEAAVRAVFAAVDRRHTRLDGTIRYENVFLWAVGKPM